jgi:hypothetical protein
MGVSPVMVDDRYPLGEPFRDPLAGHRLLVVFICALDDRFVFLRIETGAGIFVVVGNGTGIANFHRGGRLPGRRHILFAGRCDGRRIQKQTSEKTHCGSD